MPESERPGSIAREAVESLGLWISNSEVSRVYALLDEQVEAFRQRPFEGRYPVPVRRCHGCRSASRPDGLVSQRGVVVLLQVVSNCRVIRA